MKILKLDVTHELIGSKALNLKVIERSGCKVPETFVLFNDRLNTKIIDKNKNMIQKDINACFSEDKLYAVRSAKGIEDSQDDSFAGIFRSVLNVKKKNIYSALLEVARSYDHQVFKYKKQSEDIMAIDHSRNIKDAILIQEMVSPKYSGVLFSHNPINSADEMLLEMVEGLGNQLDQEGIDPLRASFKKGILTFDDRLVETDASWLKQVFKEALKIAKQFGGAIDCEWVYDGLNIYWLQVRPVTALSKIKKFENTIGKNYIQEVLKPLEFDVFMATKVKAWLKLAHEIDDDIDIEDQSLVQSFYYRPYFDHEIIRSILDEMGLDPSDVEVLVQFDGENFKSTFTILAKAVFHFSSWIEFFVNRRKRIKETFNEVAKYKETLNDLRRQLETEANKEVFLLAFRKFKELCLDIEYLNILILVGSLNARRKYRKELEVIKDIRLECVQGLQEGSLKFGKYLVDLAYINEESDLLFIEEDILLDLIQKEANKSLLMEHINKHKQVYDKYRESVLPRIIYGEENPILDKEKENRHKITGISMSKGRIKGKIRRITIDDEMDDIEAGDIIVLPFADMVFELVLAKAGGLLLESGGILSHLAILARERQIPAITAIGKTEHLVDGLLVALDGYSGEIIVLD